jgi:hypothetical protein
MTQSRSYQAAKAVESLPKLPTAKRPIFVTVALVLLWSLVTAKALGTIDVVAAISNWSSPFITSYVVYLTAMVLVPAFLLVAIAKAFNGARIALLTIYALNFVSRAYLFCERRSICSSGRRVARHPRPRRGDSHRLVVHSSLKSVVRGAS